MNRTMNYFRVFGLLVICGLSACGDSARWRSASSEHFDIEGSSITVLLAPSATSGQYDIKVKTFGVLLILKDPMTEKLHRNVAARRAMEKQCGTRKPHTIEEMTLEDESNLIRFDCKD